AARPRAGVPAIRQCQSAPVRQSFVWAEGQTISESHPNINLRSEPERVGAVLGVKGAARRRTFQNRTLGQRDAIQSLSTALESPKTGSVHPSQHRLYLAFLRIHIVVFNKVALVEKGLV